MKPDYERIAGDYREARPHYPEQLVARIAGWLPEGPLEVLDAGAGTGIGTRALAGVLGPWASILAVEPSPAMRREAASDAAPGTVWIDGRAEALPAGDGSIDLVFSAQALHWFDRPAFYRECGRVLKPGGAVAILYNNRDWRQDRFAAGYEVLLERYSPGYRRDYREFDIRGELAALDWTASTHEESEVWTRPMRPDAFMAMSRSSSRAQAARDAAGAKLFDREVETLMDRHAKTDGSVEVLYRCVLTLAAKAG
ncbi:MAG: class I SAM-dependent methyltransferase [Alphaproteobacteria bacterium]|nr:class I SAM-dependent methyltransferase [Alphaproteobacteria bacterium]